MKLNAPNILTLLRFFLTLIIIIVFLLPALPYFASEPDIPTTGFTVIDLVCAVLFIVASVTDTLDGNIARRHNLISDFGKFMDPLADKALVNSSLIVLSVMRPLYLPAVIVVLMILRDTAVDGIRFIAASRGEVIAANKWGKAKTVAQMIAIPFIFLNGFPLNYLLGDYTYIFTITLISAALALSLISGGIYLYRGRKYFWVGSAKGGKKDR